MITGRDGSWAFASATSGHLVGLGRGRQQGDTGEALELATGEIAPVPDPPGEGFDEILSMASTDDHVVVVGALLDDGGQQVDGEVPVTGRRVGYRYDPAGRQWSEMELPEVLARASTFSDAELVAGGPTGVAGAFAVSESFEALAVAEDDRWRVVAQDLVRTHGTWCATSRDRWTLSAHDQPEERSPDAPYPSTLTLQAVPFDGSPARQVDTPPLLAQFGGAGVELGCGNEVIALMVGSGGDAEVGLHVLAGDAWRTSGPPRSPGWLPSKVESGLSGPVMTYVPFEEGRAYGDRRPIEGVAVNDEGEVTGVPGPLQDVTLHFAGASPTLVVLGPMPAEDSDQERVPLRLVEIGS